MKYFFALLLPLFFAGCAVSPEICRFTDADNGRSISVRTGELFEVALTSNPSTGFRWEAMPSPCRIESRDFHIPEERRARCGAAGTEKFLVRADFTGKCTLTFVYRRSWENEPPAKTFSLEVNTRK